MHPCSCSVKLSSVILTTVFMLVVVSSLFRNRDNGVVSSSRRLVSEVSTKRIESMRQSSVSGGSTKPVQTNLRGGEETEFKHGFGSQDQESPFDCHWIPNVTVAIDGTGDYRTIGEAVASIPEKRSEKFVIHVKGGVYNETVIVPKNKNNIVMYGDGSDKTVVSGHRNRVDNPTLKTLETATFAVYGNGFVVQDMMFVNQAGPEKSQAVAFYSRSSYSVVYRCTFDGFQDTLYAHAGDQFYRECTILGTVDFIFGAARAVFQNCTILPRHPLAKQVDTVTAQSATDGIMKSGFTIINSKISSYEGARFKDVVYLGRPWRSYSKVVVIKSFLGSSIDGKGWIAWNDTSNPPPPTVTYGEFQNYGPGADVMNRVKWIGYQPEMTYQEALKYTVHGVFTEHGWIDQSCVPYDGSL